ncbi:hypothetical protein AMAG_05534 [Allomyces macrogynus ATCC 38327]|uniref:Uncharacterized protein n=1 Tax=Allomyces macrogynus (strain ATCC 38327) TaxID=578462 RepID=A0A0L0SCG0_ALLM3|nr:hypothetical protein AMAG_05534 [Allomyces macrogynus ATCC 38327]|eukprot:KNE60109.1 hypothetical protein AMAG_05534 [Allomyces macrogynus ATCC 38327]
MCAADEAIPSVRVPPRPPPPFALRPDAVPASIGTRSSARTKSTAIDARNPPRQHPTSPLTHPHSSMSTAAGAPSPVAAQQRPHARPGSTVDDAALFGPLVATAAQAAIVQVHHDAAMNRASRVLSMMSELPMQQQQQQQQRRTSRPPPPPPRRIGMARSPSLASMSDADEDEPWTEVAPSTAVSALPPPPPPTAAGLRAARGSTAVAARGMGMSAPEFDPYDVAPPVWAGAGRSRRFNDADDDASDTALYEPVTVVDDDVHDDGGHYVSSVVPPAAAAASKVGGNTPAAHGAVFDDIYQAYLDDRTVVHHVPHAAADMHSMAAQPEETDTGADADDAAEWREDLRYRARRLPTRAIRTFTSGVTLDKVNLLFYSSLFALLFMVPVWLTSDAWSLWTSAEGLSVDRHLVGLR